MHESTLAAAARELLQALKSGSYAGGKSSQVDSACEHLALEVQRSTTASRPVGISRILVAIDASLPAAHAIQAADTLAQDIGALLAVIHVIDASPIPITEIPGVSSRGIAAIEREATELCNRMLTKIRQPNAPLFLRKGSPAVEIIDTARQWNAHLIVMGSHGRSRPGKFFLGTTVEAVLRESPCPVMAVGDQSGQSAVMPANSRKIAE